VNLHHETGTLDTCALALGVRARSTIGRAPSCDLVIPDQFVSRVHASIQRFDDQHVLQDAGSSNGTILNGLRLTPAHAFPLREGDIIEIGKARLVYGDGIKQHDGLVGLLGDGGPSTQRVERAYSVKSLLRDGCQRFGGDNGAALQASIERALTGATRRIGIERCLELVATELRVDTATLYVGQPSRRLELVGTHPRSMTVPDFGPVTLDAWTDREAHHAEGPSAPAGQPDEETAVAPRRSVLAIPFFRQAVGCVVAFERTYGERLDRVDIVHAAVVAERLARAVCIGSLSAKETPFGYGD
jgi:hypothetical protein